MMSGKTVTYKVLPNLMFYELYNAVYEYFKEDFGVAPGKKPYGKIPIVLFRGDEELKNEYGKVNAIDGEVISLLVKDFTVRYNLRFFYNKSQMEADNGEDFDMMKTSHLTENEMLQKVLYHLTLGSFSVLPRKVYDQYKDQVPSTTREFISWLRNIFKENGKEDMFSYLLCLNGLEEGYQKFNFYNDSEAGIHWEYDQSFFINESE